VAGSGAGDQEEEEGNERSMIKKTGLSIGSDEVHLWHRSIQIIMGDELERKKLRSSGSDPSPR